MHAQWKVLLDDDFIEAWKHGIVITCCDGTMRRFYPRIFTHSGDYPEKYAILFQLRLALITCLIIEFSSQVFEIWVHVHALVVSFHCRVSTISE
jgi:hypothetical protein